MSMRKLVLGLLLSAAAYGQVLETTVPLGHVAKWLYAIPGQMKLYVIAEVRADTTPNSSFILYSIDCATNAITDSVDLGTRNYGLECGAYDWRHRKFYTRGGPDSTNLIVIDVATD